MIFCYVYLKDIFCLQEHCDHFLPCLLPPVCVILHLNQGKYKKQAKLYYLKGYLSNDISIFSENFLFFTKFEELL